MRRLFADCRSGEACQFRREYRALEKRHGGAFDESVVPYAVAAIELHGQFLRASRLLRTAEAQRMNGKGRRPSAAAVERLRRRQGLSLGSWDQAMRRLEELAASAKPRSFAEAARAAGAR
jgi:hypothetical protein